MSRVTDTTALLPVSGVGGGVGIRMTSCYYETGAWEAMVREWSLTLRSKGELKK